MGMVPTRESGKREHADLVRDVVPRTRGAQLDELSLKTLAHALDSTRHLLERVEPLLPHAGIPKGGGDNAATKSWRARPVASDQNLELADRRHGRCSVGTDDYDITRPLVVQPKVFRVRLAYEQRDACTEKQPNAHSVGIGITRRKALCARHRTISTLLEKSDADKTAKPRTTTQTQN
jgi:hypothetical protein